MVSDVGEMPEPLVPVEGAPRWFIRNPVQKVDIYRGAQNQADERGVDQEVWLWYDLMPADLRKDFAMGVGPDNEHYLLVERIKPNPARQAAGR